jgi:hypothetical protein
MIIYEMGMLLRGKIEFDVNFYAMLLQGQKKKLHILTNIETVKLNT